MSDSGATMIIDGKVVPRPSEGTVFGGATLNDRIRDSAGVLTEDVIPLSFGGIITLKAGSDTVSGVDLVEVTSISLDKETVSVVVGAVAPALVATVLPAGATDKTVKYSTLNGSVATVSAAGVITGKAVGTTTIRAVAGDKEDTVIVTVTAAP